MNIVTWNTQWCKGIDGIVSPERIIAGARSLLDVDVICMQEISINYQGLTGDSASNQALQIQALLPDYQVVFGAAIDEQPLGKGERQQFGNLIASRLPILQIQKVCLPSPVDRDDPKPGMSRICLVCTIQAEWGPVRVMTTHLEYYSQPQRQAQISAIASWHEMASLHAMYPSPTQPGDTDTPYQPKPHTLDTVLCGDFNFEPDSPEYQIITDLSRQNPLCDAWVHNHPEQPHPPTFRLYDETYGPEPVSCDFFFVSQSVASRVRNVRVDTLTQVSDHQPVSLELSAAIT